MNFSLIRFAFSGFLCFSGVISNSTRAPENWFYSLMIDAGSKGTRLILFRWQPELTLPRKEIQIPQQVGFKSVNPGLAAFALKPSEVKAQLKELVDFAVDKLSGLRTVHNLIPLYLKATAGLRDLVPPARDAVMQETIAFLSSYSPFYFNDSFAQVISGEEEGAYGWLSVNALKNTLGEDNGESTFGVIDLGGASLQVAFVPEKNHYILQNCYPLSLTDTTAYRTYAKSYLHYGIVEANRRLSSNIITENILKVDSVDSIQNPCYYKGYKFTPDFATSDYKIPISVEMVGTGDFDQCFKELSMLFNKGSGIQCWVRDCTFDGVYQPRLDTRKFVGIGNIGKILSFVNIPPKSSLFRIRQTAMNVCSKSFEDIQKEYPKIAEKNQKNLCFSVSYIYTVLTYALGFTITNSLAEKDHDSQIEFTNVINGTKVDWALGAIIYEANQQPPKTIYEYVKATKDLHTDTLIGKPNVTSLSAQSWLLNRGV